MAQTVGKLPEFTDDAPANPEKEVVITAPEGAEEKETPATEEEKPAEPSVDTENSPDPEKEKTEAEVLALQKEKTDLLKEIQELRGNRREIKEKKLEIVQQQIDELKDLNPDDVGLIDRVLRSKGYVTKQEAGQMFYEAAKQEELDKFLSKYPEYKPENDPNDVHWAAFNRQIEKERELGYQLPKNPHLIAQFLERVHKELNPRQASGKGATEQRIRLASVGSSSTQQPSNSSKRMDPAKRSILERGGWNEEEIRRMEENLPD